MPHQAMRRLVAIGVLAAALHLAGSTQAGAAGFHERHEPGSARQWLTSLWNAGLTFLRTGTYVPVVNAPECGPGIDPNGCSTKAATGSVPGIDPNGDQGLGLDPNGGK